MKWETAGQREGDFERLPGMGVYSLDGHRLGIVDRVMPTPGDERLRHLLVREGTGLSSEHLFIPEGEIQAIWRDRVILVACATSHGRLRRLDVAEVARR